MSRNSQSRVSIVQIASPKCDLNFKVKCVRRFSELTLTRTTNDTGQWSFNLKRPSREIFSACTKLQIDRSLETIKTWSAFARHISLFVENEKSFGEMRRVQSIKTFYGNRPAEKLTERYHLASGGSGRWMLAVLFPCNNVSWFWPLALNDLSARDVWFCLSAPSLTTVNERAREFVMHYRLKLFQPFPCFHHPRSESLFVFNLLPKSLFCVFCKLVKINLKMKLSLWADDARRTLESAL